MGFSTLYKSALIEEINMNILENILFTLQENISLLLVR